MTHPTYDLIIRNGTLVDGTGAPAFKGDIAVSGDKIAAIGEVEGSAAQEIDATGKIVTPGWVDIHTHYDGQVTWDPECTPSGWHGVTTVVMGNCGVGFAPVRPDEKDFLIQLMEGVEDIPGTALSEGMSWNWESFSEYLNEVERAPKTLDVGAMLAHGALRAYVLGKDRANDAATGPEIDAMRNIAKDAIVAGAVGISTTRTIGHRAGDGEVAAGTYAASEELVALGTALKNQGRRVFSVVSDDAVIEGEKTKAEFAWMEEISKANKVPVTYMVLDVAGTTDKWKSSLENGLQKNREGAWLVPQVAGKPACIMVGFESTDHLFSRCPSYQALSHLPYDAQVTEMKKPEIRNAVLQEWQDVPKKGMNRILSNFIRLFPLGSPPNYEPSPEQSIDAISQRDGLAPEAAAYDQMLQRDGHELLYLPFHGFGGGNLDNLHTMMTTPDTVLGLSDGGAHVGIICDGSMPTFMLTHWVRDRTTGKRLTLEHAVNIQTQKTAELFGFEDRGVLQKGYLADINVIDLDGLELEAPQMVYDLPAGGQRLMQGAKGYRATIKSGQIVRENDNSTGAQPGKLLRGPQPLKESGSHAA